ncbi:MAG: hypothetical protein KDJ89_01535, partial [Notoacmeibacter sp.]|nr:hypothetical protein [Notoacmeibacter sp.]
VSTNFTTPAPAGGNRPEARVLYHRAQGDQRKNGAESGFFEAFHPDPEMAARPAPADVPARREPVLPQGSDGNSFNRFDKGAAAKRRKHAAIAQFCDITSRYQYVKCCALHNMHGCLADLALHKAAWCAYLPLNGRTETKDQPRRGPKR